MMPSPSINSLLLAIALMGLACGGDKTTEVGTTSVSLEPTAGFSAVELSATPSTAPTGDLGPALRQVATQALTDCKAFAPRGLPSLELTLRWNGDGLKAAMEDTMQDTVKACIAKSFERQGLSGGGEPGKLHLAMRAK